MTDNKKIKRIKSDKERIEIINRIMTRAVDVANSLHFDEPMMVWTAIETQDEALEDTPSESWDAQIQEEYERYLNDDDTIHNRIIHQDIINIWKSNSPRMYQRLDAKGMLEAVAYVSQQRMWEAMDDYLEAGYSITDAREQAERDHLMLELEDSESYED